MKKNLVIALILLAPISVFGQKFGHINSSDIIALMPEFAQAQTEVKTLEQQYKDELKYLQDEYEKKVTEYQAQESTLPDNIKARREQELQEIQQKASEFLSTSQTTLQSKYEELMGAISTKLIKAVQEVGEEGAYICIFDAASGAVPYISSTLTTDVTEPVKAKLGIK
jgi:outer membrane protein